MAVSGADRQQAYRQRQREASARQTEEIAALRTEIEAVRTENTALKTALSLARQAAAPKPPRDLAQFLYPSTRRRERP